MDFNGTMLKKRGEMLQTWTSNISPLENEFIYNESMNARSNDDPLYVQGSQQRDWREDKPMKRKIQVEWRKLGTLSWESYKYSKLEAQKRQARG